MPRIEFIYPVLLIIGFGLPTLVIYSRVGWKLKAWGAFGFLLCGLGWWITTSRLSRNPPGWLPGDRGWLTEYLLHARALGVVLLFGSMLTLFFAPSEAWFRSRVIDPFQRFARRRRVCVALVGLAAFGIGILFSALNKPIPRVHDEFSYLLAADTFAHGRLSNPTHPNWVHFESFHIFHQPTYMSKYPPAQGLTLALGEVMTGSPIVGIWLGTAFGCTAVCWMLYGLLPPHWALVGGLLTLLSPTLQSNWGQSFQGGAIAMGGAALAFGAGARILRSQGILNAFILAIGVSILAISRPFEGLVTILPLGLILAVWLLSNRGGTRLYKLATVALPFISLMSVTLGAKLYDNWRVTGVATRFPYQNDELIYWSKNAFGVSIKPEPVVYNDPVLQQFFDAANNSDHSGGTLGGRVKQAFNHFSKRIVWIFSLFYFRLHLLIPFVVALQIRSRKVLFAGSTIILMLIAHSFVLFYWPHYSAPIAPLIFFILAEGLRRLSLSGGRFGQVLVAGVLLTSALELVAVGVHRLDPTPGFHSDRARIAAELESTDGQHLVLVRYSESHNPASEWVYNGADLDGSKVVWARDRGEVHNQALLESFRGRKLWRLDADEADPKLKVLR